MMPPVMSLGCVICGRSLDGWLGTYRAVVQGIEFKPICRSCRDRGDVTWATLDLQATQIIRDRQKREQWEAEQDAAERAAERQQKEQRLTREADAVRAALAAGFDPWEALPVRVRYALQRSEIRTADQVASMEDQQLMKLRNFGVSALASVRAAIPYRPIDAQSRPPRIARSARLSAYRAIRRRRRRTVRAA